MSPEGGGEPNGNLAATIDEAFGSFADFQGKLKDAGVNQFGSGWAWLVLDGGSLVVATPNQDNPISDGKTPSCRRRRLGARLLPLLPEPPPRLHRRLVEHGRLGKGWRSASPRPSLRRDAHAGIQGSLCRDEGAAGVEEDPARRAP